MAEGGESAEISLSLEEELTCSICLELFSDPVSLPCLHSFCKSCLQGMHTTNVQNTVGLHCPQCRKLITLPNGSVNELPKNFNLSNIVKKFQKHQGRKAEQQQEKNEENVICQIHNKMTRYYCKTCLLLVCTECCTNHQNHEIDFIETAHGNCMEELDSVMLPQLRELCDSLEERKRSLKENHDHMTTSSNSLCDEIGRLFSDLKNKLDLKQAEMISEVKQREQNFVLNYQSEMKSMKGQLEDAMMRLSEAQRIRGLSTVSALKKFGDFSSSITHDMKRSVAATLKKDSVRTFKEGLSTTQLSKEIENIRSSVNTLNLNSGNNSDVPEDDVWWPPHPPRRGRRGHHPPPRFGHHPPPPPGHHPPPPGHHPPPPGHHLPPPGHHPPPPGHHPPHGQHHFPGFYH